MSTSIAQLRSLLSRAHAQQEERNIRLAREIHDDVSQKLTALSIELSLLQKRLGKNGEAAKVGDLLELVSGISSSVRKTMNELRPKVLDEFGLVAAIKYECQRQEKLRRQRIIFFSNLEDVKLPPTRAGEVFRLFQEAFSHLLQAEDKPEIHVRIARQRLQLQIDVQREGKTSPDCDEHQIVLLQIQEHARRLGGKMISFRKDKKSGLGLKIPLGQK